MHHRRHECEGSAGGDGNAAVVDDAARGIAREFVVARHKVGVVEPQGAGDQAAHVDLRACAKQHAVRIQDKDLPVGSDFAHDGAGLGAGHAVERDGTGAGLVEAHGLAAADRELRPVDGGFIAGLVDRGRAAGLVDGGAASGYLAACWACKAGQARHTECCA